MADSPKEGEAAQALFCAIADNQGTKLELLPNYKAFKIKYQKDIDDVKNKVKIDMTMTALETWLSNNDEWYKSSIAIANKLLVDLEKLAKKTYNKIKPKGIDLFYVRGDEEIFGSMQTLFTSTKKAIKKENPGAIVFDNINKWTPADIYFASDYARTLLSNIAKGQDVKYTIGSVKTINLHYFRNFNLLNEFLRRLIESGDLLPLSLKKAPNEVKIKRINFLETDYAKAMENVSYKELKLSSDKAKSIFESIDFRIYFSKNTGHNLQFRDKVGPNHMNYNFTATITGGTEAFDGSIGGGTIGQVISEVDSELGKNFTKQNIESKGKKFIELIEKSMSYIPADSTEQKLLKQIFDYCKKYSPNLMRSYPQSVVGVNQFYTDLGVYLNSLTMKIDGKVVRYDKNQKMKAGANILLAKYFGGILSKNLENNKLKHEIVVAIVAAASSQSKSSAPYFKASDPSAF
jgi:hypothetical protein